MTEWYPIRVVSRRTGLSTHAIRAWEKRYGAVDPKRTGTNRRLYSSEDLERLALLRRATLAGRSIGQIAKLPTRRLKDLVEEDEAAARTVARPAGSERFPRSTDGSKFLDACFDAAERLDSAAFQTALDRASIFLSRPALMEQVIVPLMHRIGDAWRDGSLRVAHEHLASALVRSYVGGLNGAFHVPSSAPEVVVTTPAGQLHEIGALLAAVTATAEGWRATYLGPSLPAEEIAAAARQKGARAVALSIVYPIDDPHMSVELSKLAQLLGPSTPILVGGRGAPSYRQVIDESGARYIPDIQSLRNELEAIRAGEREK
jgi:DNA-binding transcriptional MerR regulator/methylmalonyl-CoA mutase cobalamin-binding subunit